MLALDASTTYGARVMERLAADEILWLTTISGSQTPQPIARPRR